MLTPSAVNTSATGSFLGLGSTDTGTGTPPTSSTDPPAGTPPTGIFGFAAVTTGSSRTGEDGVTDEAEADGLAVGVATGADEPPPPDDEPPPLPPKVKALARVATGTVIGVASVTTPAGWNDTATDPEPLGTVAVIEVSEITVSPVAATPPNFTSVAPVKPTPVIVTVEPAAPDEGETPDTCGHVPATPPLAAHFKVGYDPAAVFQTEESHEENVEGVVIAPVGWAPVVVVLKALAVDDAPVAAEATVNVDEVTPVTAKIPLKPGTVAPSIDTNAPTSGSVPLETVYVTAPPAAAMDEIVIRAP